MRYIIGATVAPGVISVIKAVGSIGANEMISVAVAVSLFGYQTKRVNRIHHENDKRHVHEHVSEEVLSVANGVLQNVTEFAVPVGES